MALILPALSDAFSRLQQGLAKANPTLGQWGRNHDSQCRIRRSVQTRSTATILPTRCRTKRRDGQDCDVASSRPYAATERKKNRNAGKEVWRGTKRKPEHTTVLNAAPLSSGGPGQGRRHAKLAVTGGTVRGLELNLGEECRRHCKGLRTYD
jgi:hypothetical protein